MSYSINPIYKSVYISIYDVDIYQINFILLKYTMTFICIQNFPFCHLTIKILCISLSIYIYICVCVCIYAYTVKPVLRGYG